MKNSNLRIAYITDMSFPSKYAKSINVMEMCNALSYYSEVSLIAPRYHINRLYKHKQIFTYYSLNERFKLILLTLPDLPYIYKIKYNRDPPYILHRMHSFIFNIVSIIYVFMKNYNLVYTRNQLIAFILSFFKPVVYEIHFYSTKPFSKFLERGILKRAKIIVYVTPFLKKLYSTFYDVNVKQLILPDGVNIEKIDRIPPKKIKKKGKVIVGYIGSTETLGFKKGVDLILEAAYYLRNVLFYIIGIKTDEEFAKYLSLIKRKNVILLKRMPHKEAISYLKSFNIVLLPLPYSIYNAYFTSPIKLFEYMATKKCIIASDLPSIRYVLDDDEAIFFEPDNVRDLIKKIKMAIGKKCKNDDLYKKVIKNYTWKIRAKKVLLSLIT